MPRKCLKNTFFMLDHDSWIRKGEEILFEKLINGSERLCKKLTDGFKLNSRPKNTFQKCKYGGIFWVTMSGFFNCIQPN